MNTIHCRVKQNEYQDIGRRHVTPAEAVILRAIHDPAAHMHANQASTPEDRKRYWAVIVNPVASGVAMTHEEEDGRENGQKHVRTTGEELARLRRHYPTRSRNNPKIHIVDELFPGLNPQLPETFEEIGLDVAPPDAAPAPSKRGHGPEMAERTGEENVVSYDAAPKAGKTPKAKAGKTPKAPKAKAADADPAPVAGDEPPAE